MLKTGPQHQVENPFTNDSKTTFIVLRSARERNLEQTFELRVGGAVVPESDGVGVLGVKFTNDLSWKHHVTGLVSHLRQINGLLARLAAHIPRRDLLPVVHGLMMSKVRYGLPVFATVRTKTTDEQCGLMGMIQREINRAMRLICNKKLTDRTPISELVLKTGIQPVNQVAAESLLRETWRSWVADLPLGTYLKRTKDSQLRTTRSTGTSFIVKDMRNDAQRQIAMLWNELPAPVRQMTTINENTKAMFRAFNEFAKTMPL